MNFYIKTNIKEILLSRLQYVIHFVNCHPSKPKDLHFMLGDDGPQTIQYGIERDGTTELFIPANQMLFVNKKLSTKLYANPYWVKKQKKIHSLEIQIKKELPFFIEGKFSFDLFETIFFHISRYEEILADDSNKNQAGWLTEELQFLVQNQLEKEPVVDHLIVAFFEAITGNPIKSPTKYSLSHDVDILFRFKPAYKFLRSLASSVVNRRGTDHLIGSLKYYLRMVGGNEKDPFDYFEELFALNNISDRRIYLMSGGASNYDRHYSLNNHFIKGLVQKAKSRNYHFGLHPSYFAGWEEKMFMEEKNNLEEYLEHSINHSRQHWLRFNWEITPYLIDRLGIKEDSSLGYNKRIGYRCGTGFSYHLYDFKNEKPFDWKERPLVLMESAAMHEANHDAEQLIAILKTFLESNRQNTCIEMNFHNSNFDPTLATGRALRKFYCHQLPELISHK